jgi:hypothetical protein
MLDQVGPAAVPAVVGVPTQASPTHDHDGVPCRGHDSVAGRGHGGVAGEAPAQQSAYQWDGYADTPPPGRFYRLIMTIWTRPAWLAPLAVLACLGVAFTYVLNNNPADAKADPLGPCAFKLLTGLDCPGCGGTRMVWYLLHGNVLEAARYHIIALLAVPVLVWAYVVWAAKRIFGVTVPSIRIHPIAIGIFLAVWMVFAVLRDLPWAPFNLLYVS